MSFYPMRFSNLMETYNRLIAEFMDPSFELDSLSTRLPPSFRSGYIRPWRNIAASESGYSKIHVDDKEFKVHLDVKQFQHNELSVKLCGGFITVEGKHGEKEDDYGSITRHFIRKYKLPKNVEPSEVISNISTDGILTLTAPKKDIQPTVREIPIAIISEPSVQSPEIQLQE